MVKTPRAASSPSAFRPLNLPEPAYVEAEEGWPSAVTQGKTRYDVISIEDLWRVDEEWWRDAPVVRTYFEVLLNNGHRLTLFFDHGAWSWFWQRHG